MVLSTMQANQEGLEDNLHSSIASRYGTHPLPQWSLPEEELSKEAAYQVIHDELEMDGNPKFDLGSFTTTYMEPECDKLILESLNKNYIDMDEYPITTAIQEEIMGVTRISLSTISRRFDGWQMGSNWFVLDSTDEGVFHGRIHLRLHFDDGYHVLDKSSDYLSKWLMLQDKT